MSDPAPKLVPAFLTWTDDTGLAQQFRCFSKSRDYEASSDITSHPVETKSDITDNVRPKMRDATVYFFETNSPIEENNWASPTTGVQVLTVPGPPAQGTSDPIQFDDYDGLRGVKGIAASGVLVALGALDAIVKTPTVIDAATVVGAGLLEGSGATDIVTDLIVGTTAIEVGEFAAAEAILEAPGEPVPTLIDPPDPPDPTPGQSFSVQTQEFSGVLSDGPQDYVALTFQLLEELRISCQVVNLITAHWTLSNLVIAKVHVHEDAETGNAADIQVDLKEIRFVETETVPAPAPSLPRASAKVNKGEQGTADADAKTESLAHAALKKAAGLVRTVAGGAFG